MTRILLTGASGFVGGAILRRLLSLGHEVDALHSRGQPALSAPGLAWHRTDLLAASTADLLELSKRAGASHCVHAAWYTNHSDYLSAEINLDWAEATLRLADAFYASGGVRFVGLGTCLEYDQDVGDGRFAESMPIRPTTIYSRCKAEVFHKLSRGGDGVRSFAWARVFFVYGPGDRENRLIPYILGNLREGKPVASRYGGMTRDYIHVDDLAGQIVRIVHSDERGSINTGSGRAIPLKEIFRLAGDLAGRPDLVLTNDALDPDQSPRIEADMSHFERIVGSVDARPMRDGLAAMVVGQP